MVGVFDGFRYEVEAAEASDTEEEDVEVSKEEDSEATESVDEDRWEFRG